MAGLVSTLYVSSTGGHLSELLRLAERLDPDPDDVWVTHESAQSRTVLTGRQVVFVPEVAPRDVAALARALPGAPRLLRTHRPTRAISAGAGVALAYLPYLARRGVRCHYVESMTRTAGPSLTGRVLSGVPGVRLHCRYPAWSRGRWRYAGNDLDAFRVLPRADGPGECLRVTVMIGTGSEPFERLLVPLAELLAPGGPVQAAAGRSVDVFWQTGNQPVPGMRPSGLIPQADLDARLAASDVVLTHAGVGCALAALRAGVVPLVVARRPPRETPDGHQAQFAAELAGRGLARVLDPERMGAGDLLSTTGLRVIEEPLGPLLLEEM